MGGVEVGASCLVETDLVLFCFGDAAAITLPKVLPYLLLGPLGLARTGLLGVCFRGVGARASAACPSDVMTAMISNSCFVSVGVWVTLAAVASNSASICLASSLEVRGVINFSLPFLEMTGMGGSFVGLSSSSSCMMCFFLDLEEVLTGGSSHSFSKSSSVSVGELSVANLSPSPSD